MFNDRLSFLSNNVKRIKASQKRLKLFEYFRKLSTPVRFASTEECVFFQKTHSSVDAEKNGTIIF